MVLSQQLATLQTNKTKTIKQQFFLAKHLSFVEALHLIVSLVILW